jgi:RNA 3'-terminal phosphate cyclase (ATP)
MLKIDGSYGEGGGQILRTALTLACITSTPIEVEQIRANRAQGGLRPQHLMCLKAAADICDADVTGDYVGSERLTFFPGKQVKPGTYHWDIKTAGSLSLLLQTVMLPLALANGASEVKVSGGTHVPMSPSAHYLRDVYAPMLIQSGAELSLNLNRLGWYPRGQGEMSLNLEGWAQLQGQDLLERGELERIFGYGIASNLPAHIPQRLVNHAERQLNDLQTPLDLRPIRDNTALGKGAAMCLVAEYANGRAGFSLLGEQGYPAEKVAEEVSINLQLFHLSNASVDEHLADQLVLVLALAQGESQFITQTITDHLRTNIWVIQQFLPREIHLDESTGHVRVGD